MCIFIGDVIRVAKTRILIVPLGNGKQLTIYENSVESIGKNAMVLPVPQGDVQLVDTSIFPDLFEKCEDAFPKPRSFDGGWARPCPGDSVPPTRLRFAYSAWVATMSRSFHRLPTLLAFPAPISVCPPTFSRF